MMITIGIGCLPVVDDQQLIGIVTKTDLLRCLRAQDAV
jgi:CBS domain-containing protein